VQIPFDELPEGHYWLIYLPASQLLHLSKNLVDGSALTTATGARKNNLVYLEEPRVYKDGHPADRTGKSHS